MKTKAAIMYAIVARKIQMLSRMGPSIEKLHRKQASFSTHLATVTFGYRIIGFPL